MRNVAVDDRGVSTTLGYVLTLTITAILISGLLIAGGTLVEDQRDRIAQEELSVSAEQLASGLSEADRLAESADGGVMAVRIWLPDRVAGGSYTLELTNESTSPNQPARTTIVATAQGANAETTVSIRTSVPVANRTVLGGPLTVSHRDADGDGSRELVVNESRGLAPQEPEAAAMAHEEVVFVDADTNELSSVAPDGTVTRYGVDAEAIGPKQIDIDGDGLREIPYVDSSNRLRVVDAAGEVQTLTTDAAHTPLQADYTTLLGVGELDGETSVFYLNTTDTVGGEASIYRVGIDGESEQVTADGSGVDATAIAGLGDMNGDDENELVYVGSSQGIHYIDDGEEYTGTDIGVNNGAGIAAPRVFASGEADNIPYIDGSNEVKLYPSRPSDALTGGAVKSPISGIDFGGDERLEVVYVDSDDSTINYVYRNNGTVVAVTDEDGDPITADRGVGVA